MINKRKQLGIYIHIPFCVKKCNYCDFLSTPANESDIKEYISTLIKEINNCKHKYNEYTVETIFIGGGTPSSIKEEYICEILQAVYNSFSIDSSMEITIETNPGTITKEKLSRYKAVGINRLSIGLQSANNNELNIIGRIHTYEDFLESFNLSRSAGFNNINIDLMFALPDQTLKSWVKTIESIIKLEPEHISAYSLIIEEGTNFYKEFKDNKLNLPCEDADREMYNAVKDILKDNGYIRYEISNFSKTGCECKHNTFYWRRVDYLGLGLGAASLINNIRIRNTNEIKKYNINIEADKSITSQELLKEKDQMEEFMFLGLRMIEGICKNKFKDTFNKDIKNIYGSVIKRLKEEELLEESEANIRLTDKGIDLSNYALAKFL